MHQSRFLRALSVCVALIITASAFAAPPRVQSVSINQTSVMSGQTAGCTITLNAPAGKHGVTVTLTSSNSAAVAAPASVFFPNGQQSMYVTLQTWGVATTTTATITATLGNSVSANLAVLPAQIRNIIVSPTGVHGGEPVTVIVYLTGWAPPDGAPVTFGSSDPSLALPQSEPLVVPANDYLHANGRIETFGTATRTRVTISATYNGTVTADLDVLPAELYYVAVSPSQVVGGSGTAEVTVRLSGTATAGGITVYLSSSDPSVAAVPSSVVVPEGAKSTTFTVAPAAVAATTNVSIGASYGLSSTYATLQVDPAP